jgi:carbamoyl-phosphate synthase small subunit
LGGTTAKLKFGHHGINQPVKNIQTGRIEITSQNHGFHVLAETLPASADKSHTNLNDHTSEGLDCPDSNAFSVQYHPEAAPGPHDAAYLFDRFVDLMTRKISVAGLSLRNPSPFPAKEKKT